MSEATGISIAEAISPDDVEAVRTLCWAYRDFLVALSPSDRQITETFYPVPKYRSLMDDLPNIHAPPRGIMLLARDTNGVSLGCGMTHPLTPEIAEIKRVFTTEAARGKGIARALCLRLIDHARAAGFGRLVLDTSKTLAPAQALYTGLGFRSRGPYQDIPSEVLPNLLFYELIL